MPPRTPLGALPLAELSRTEGTFSGQSGNPKIVDEARHPNNQYFHDGGGVFSASVIGSAGSCFRKATMSPSVVDQLVHEHVHALGAIAEQQRGGLGAVEVVPEINR